MDRRFTVDGNELRAHLAVPTRARTRVRGGVVIAHGFPAEAGGGINSTASFPALADRIAAEVGCAGMAYASRGVDQSKGQFSLVGWRRDLGGAIDHLAESTDCTDIWLVGFGTGGALAMVAGARDERVRGVAAIAAPADFVDWGRNPRKLLLLAREIGVVDDPEFPSSFDEWAAEIAQVRAVEAAAAFGERDLIVIHGSDDESVPLFDARAVADACEGSDLRVIPGAGHHLRHDPRAIAILLGWLERQRQKLMLPAS